MVAPMPMTTRLEKFERPREPDPQVETYLRTEFRFGSGTLDRGLAGTSNVANAERGAVTALSSGVWRSVKELLRSPWRGKPSLFPSGP